MLLQCLYSTKVPFEILSQSANHVACWACPDLDMTNDPCLLLWLTGALHWLTGVNADQQFIDTILMSALWSFFSEILSRQRKCEARVNSCDIRGCIFY